MNSPRLIALLALLLAGCDTNEGNTQTGEGGCPGETYNETLPSRTANIAGIKASFSTTPRDQFVLDLLDARYPIGSYLVSESVDVAEQNCIDWIVGELTSATETIRYMDTLVHECGHLLDLGLGDAGQVMKDVFVINEQMTFECAGGDSTDRYGNTFARSRIRNDEFEDAFPPCVGGNQVGCDFYAETYLNGDPDDGVFDSGDQGLNLLLEEVNQYVNSLATAYAFNDQQDGYATSARDGILTFLWYLERYLHLARTDYPEAYAFITGDACYRQAILTIWGRAQLYLDTTAQIDSLGINDGDLEPLVLEPVLLDEIERIRAAEGC